MKRKLIAKKKVEDENIPEPRIKPPTGMTFVTEVVDYLTEQGCTKEEIDHYWFWWWRKTPEGKALTISLQEAREQAEEATKKLMQPSHLCTCCPLHRRF